MNPRQFFHHFNKIINCSVSLHTTAIINLSTRNTTRCISGLIEISESVKNLKRLTLTILSTNLVCQMITYISFTSCFSQCAFKNRTTQIIELQNWQQQQQCINNKIFSLTNTFSSSWNIKYIIHIPVKTYLPVILSSISNSFWHTFVCIWLKESVRQIYASF